MSNAPEHCDWEERLQDGIDSDLDPVQCAALDEHLASCTSCHARMNALRTLEAALSKGFLQATPEESFDRRVLERIASAAKADRAAARARLEREWRAQMAALSHQWRSALRSMLLNGLAGTTLLVAVATTFDILPRISRLIDQAELLTQYVSCLPHDDFASSGRLDSRGVLAGARASLNRVLNWQNPEGDKRNHCKASQL